MERMAFESTLDRDAGLLSPGAMRLIYFDHRVDAGELSPGRFEPDLSFFADESFGLMTKDDRTLFTIYDLSTIYEKRIVAGFGGVHTFDPKSKLFSRTDAAFGDFAQLIKEEWSRAVCIIEGEVRGVNPTLADEQIFALHGELGKAEALARRVGMEVVGAEPMLGLNHLARKYGVFPVLDYLSLRLLPQYHLLAPEQRPAPNTYIISVFRNRPYLSSLRYLQGIDSYIFRLADGNLPHDRPWPDREECLRETTYEYIVKIPEDKRTITQQIAFEHNLQRDRRLYSDILRYSGEGKHVWVNYGDVHLRALDAALRSDEYWMRVARRDAHSKFVSPNRR
jgi:hypothetical protein